MAMLGRCSRASLFHRFHGFSDGVAYFGVLLRDGPFEQTLLAWYGSTCVGVATLGVGPPCTPMSSAMTGSFSKPCAGSVRSQ
jgi:hypothetical protein